ncbi:uncharacterized protein FA14DRAFT_189713 [Meira miltonrushii]|uniref:Uncharacterized protein n=1 Tax=Meira miltonrushii TaxID=1280837 RepID=A0A316VJU6_9BASI|nr:uncharacterized protein FA14DRAFT_189713 [Meira miltonrushii]PWN35775.1 hypothetical protein FA14DRAFT_189713 [Meira miltonrushii]
MTITPSSAIASGGGQMTTGSQPLRSSHNHHHPYRLEVHAVTSVSVSLLWSQRPFPLSAIPRSNFRQSRGVSGALKANNVPRGSPVQRIQANENVTSSVTASRSPNRKVTKVTVRNISPAKRGRGGKTSVQRRDSEDWQSDDAATAVDEEDQYIHDGANNDMDKTLDLDTPQSGSLLASHDDDIITPSEASDDLRSNILDSSVTVCINGVPWSKVVIGDSGTEEAFIVVYGLNPGRDYEMHVNVEDKQSAISVTTEVDEKRSSDASAIAQQLQTSVDRTSTVASGNAVQIPRIKRTHTPPMQDTSESISNDVPDTSAPVIASSLTSNGAAKVAAIQAAVRKARKDASRAESALRNEIEAIRRGLERMSDVDHRSKQKVLALQESIRQATTQSKDIDEEAIAVESEREVWEERVKEKDDELEQVRTEVEEKVRLSQSNIRNDTEEIEALEKELQHINKSIEDKQSNKEKLEGEKIVELEQELARIHSEIELTLRRPSLPPTAGFYGMIPQQQQSQGGALIPPQVGRGRGGRASRGTARGAGNSGNSAANPSSRKHQNRQNRHHGQQGVGHHAAGGSSGSGGVEQDSAMYAPYSQDYPNFSQQNAGAHSSILNPNNPEFIPSNALGSASNSPMTSRRALYQPAVDHSPTIAGRFPFSSAPFLTGENDNSRRGSASHLDIPSTNHANTSSNIGHSPNTNTWLGGTGSPWAPASNSLAPSPQVQHDIWGAPGTTAGLPATNSPHLGISSSAAPGGPSSTIRTKTSIPFGLNASLLRGGANPSFTQNRFGDDSNPFMTASPNLSQANQNTRGGSGSLAEINALYGFQDAKFGGLYGLGQHDDSVTGGNSAPVSPTQAISEVPQNIHNMLPDPNHNERNQ